MSEYLARHYDPAAEPVHLEIPGWGQIECQPVPMGHDQQERRYAYPGGRSYTLPELAGIVARHRGRFLGRVVA